MTCVYIETWSLKSRRFVVHSIATMSSSLVNSPMISFLTPTTSALALSFVFIAYVYLSPLFYDKEAIPHLGGFSLLTAWPFFSRRYDFLRNGFKKTGEKLFQFNVLQHRVVALSGPEARHVFFNDKHLAFAEGYRLLMGGVPNTRDISIDAGHDPDNLQPFIKRLYRLLNKQRTQDMTPILLDDMHKRMESWGSEGKINPFREIYDLVFQMTVRMATCDEFASNLVEVNRVHRLYWDLEKSATAIALLLPWFPSKAKRTKKQATQELYTIFTSYIEKRRAAQVPSSDAIDVMIQEGIENAEIIQYIFNVIFAGVVNTGINSCWLLIHLAAHPNWLAKVRAEVSSLIAKHTDPTSREPLYKRLAAIPPHGWEDELPVLDTCLRETLRVSNNITLLRRNIVADLSVASEKKDQEEKILQRGTFLAFPTDDVHLNPEIYTNPLAFDPDRYAPGREEDKRVPLSYVAWGTGRHPCAGMRVAKLEIKMIVVFFLALYQYELVDKNDKFPDPFPRPDRNDHMQARPLGEPCYFKLKKVAE